VVGAVDRGGTEVLGFGGLPLDKVKVAYRLARGRVSGVAEATLTGSGRGIVQR